MINVYDDLFTEREQDHIENFLRDPKFPWFLPVTENHYTTNNKNIKANSNHLSQECVLLTHVFYLDSKKNSDNYALSDFILNRFLERTNYPFKALYRSKANLQLKSQESDFLYTTPHVDESKEHKVLIYYANNCDGDTYIFNNHKINDVLERIVSKKGRFVMFDGHYYHAAGLARKSDFRLNVNFNIL